MLRSKTLLWFTKSNNSNRTSSDYWPISLLILKQYENRKRSIVVFVVLVSRFRNGLNFCYLPRSWKHTRSNTIIRLFRFVPLRRFQNVGFSWDGSYIIESLVRKEDMIFMEQVFFCINFLKPERFLK